MSIFTRALASLKALGCLGHDRFWGKASGACLCGRISRVMLHPQSWEAITMTPAGDGQPTLWGLPTVNSETFPPVDIRMIVEDRVRRRLGTLVMEDGRWVVRPEESDE